MVKFKNPFKKGGEIAIVSNEKIKEGLREQQAKQLLLKQNEHNKNPSSDEEFDDLDGDEALNDERDEDLSRTETIDPIKLNKRRLDSLQQIYAELDKEDKEQSLKLKILKKRETIDKKKRKYQEYMEIKAEQDKYYEMPKNSEGYFVLKEEKWNDEYDELLLKLANTTDEDTKKAINKELKRLEGIRSKNKTKNRMNRIVRGINKTSQKIGSVTRGVGKFADELGQMGGQNQSKQSKRKGGGKKIDFDNFFVDKSGGKSKGSGSEIDWDNFFKDKPKKKANGKQTKEKKAKKKKPAKRKKKTAKRKKKTAPEPQEQPKRKGVFDGF